MNLKEILELIDKVADRGIASVEIERAGVKVKVEGKRAEPFSITHQVLDSNSLMSQGSIPVSASPALPAAPSQAALDEASEAGLHIITSPIVGTFYRAPNPEAGVFVNVGDRVTKGGVLCIIEAMKLMNEIESDTDGVIVRIYPQNGQPVEFGEKLFAVRV